MERQQDRVKRSKRLTTAGLIAVTTGTLLMMAWAIFPSAPAFADGQATVNWNGVNGANNLPCTGGTTLWIFEGFGNVQNTTFTSVVLTVNGTQYPYQDPQNNNGSFQFSVTGPGTSPANTTASVTFSWTGDAPGNDGGLTISHCTPGTTTTTTTVPVTTTTTTTTAGGGGGGGGTTSVAPTSTSSPTIAPTTVHQTKSQTESVAPTTVRPGGTAFTGVEDVVPLGVVALTLLTGGSGLLWAGSRRRRDEDGGDE